ncbi:hypothetical protein ASF21_10790 [Arthrobacter sp. Leaf234]|nr:hypothetical protein ASF21_10790 [Arthrobacter sp. Leaf234]
MGEPLRVYYTRYFPADVVLYTGALALAGPPDRGCAHRADIRQTTHKRYENCTTYRWGSCLLRVFQLEKVVARP